MTKKKKTFIEIRDDMKSYLSKRRLFTHLKKEANVSEFTVQETFKVNEESLLVQKKLLTWKTAIKIIEERKKLEKEAEDALNS